MRYLSYAVLILLLVVGLTGCKSKPIQDFNNVPIQGFQEEPSLERIERVIGLACAARGWRTEHLAEGHLVATLNIRTHTAIVDILFSKKDFSISYYDSTNLKYNAKKKTIHQNYNRWINILRTDIERALLEAKRNDY